MMRKRKPIEFPYFGGPHPASAQEYLRQAAVTPFAEFLAALQLTRHQYLALSALAAEMFEEERAFSESETKRLADAALAAINEPKTAGLPAELCMPIVMMRLLSAHGEIENTTDTAEAVPVA
jgi:hypothetical protein